MTDLTSTVGIYILNKETELSKFLLHLKISRDDQVIPNEHPE